MTNKIFKNYIKASLMSNVHFIKNEKCETRNHKYSNSKSEKGDPKMI